MNRSTPASPKQIIAVGLGVLTAHTAILWWLQIPPFLKYPAAAERLASGQMDAERLLDFSPLYLRLHMLLAELTSQPERVAVALQVLMVSAGAAAFYALLRRHVAPLWATLAIIGFALDRHLLVYERVLEPEALILAALMGLLSLLVVGDAADGEGAGPVLGTWRLLSAGGLAALCVTARPTFLVLFAILVPLHLWLLDAQPRRWMRRCVIFAAPLVLALLAVAWHSQDAADPGAPVMNPGTVFFEGHQPLSRGTSAIYPPSVWQLQHDPSGDPDAAHAFYRDVARATTGEPLAASEVNEFWARRGANYMVDAPLVSLRRAARQLRYAAHSFRWHDLPAARVYDRVLPIPNLPFSLLASLALFGALYALPSWRHYSLIYGLAASQVAVLLVFYVSARQRLPLLPAVYLFAGLAMQNWTAKKANEAQTAEIQTPVRRHLHAVLAVLLAVALMLPDDIMVDQLHQMRSSEAASSLFVPIRQREDLHLARHMTATAAALAAAPWWLDDLYPAHFPRDAGPTLEERVLQRVRARFDAEPTWNTQFDLAALEVASRHYPAAIELLEPLVNAGFVVYRGSKQPSDPRIFMATALAKTGQSKGAITRLGEVLEDSPGDLFAACELAAIEDREPDPILERWWSGIDIRWICGQASLRHQRYARAEEQLTWVVERLPKLRPAHIELAVALGAQGRIDQAAERMLIANNLRQEPVQHAAEIIEIFETWLALHVDDHRARWASAQLFAQHGRFERALEVFDALPSDLRERAEPWRQQIAEAAELSKDL